MGINSVRKIIVLLVGISGAYDLSTLPINTWVDVKINQRFSAEFTGGIPDTRHWSLLKYNSADGRFLYYEGYHNSLLDIPQTIYGNTLYSFNPLTDTADALSVSNWRRTGSLAAGYTWFNPESLTHPKPFDRHTYGTVMLCDRNNTYYMGLGVHAGSAQKDIWAFSLDSNRWRRTHDSAVASALIGQEFFENHFLYLPGDDTLYLVTRTSTGLRVFACDLTTERWMPLFSQSFNMSLWAGSSAADTKRRRFLLYGGKDRASGQFTGDMCVFYPDSQKFVMVSQAGGAVPAVRVRAGFVYDSNRDLYLMHGGDSTNGSSTYSDTWLFNPETRAWKQIFPSNSAVFSRYLAYDPVRDLVAGFRVKSGVGQVMSLFKYDTLSSAVEQAALGQGPAWLSVRANPFRQVTRIIFGLMEKSSVCLEVMSVRGQRVAVLASGYREPGPHSVSWNGTDRAGRPVAPGVYYLNLSTNGTTLYKGVILSR